jgi:pyrroline-5-carboxylate reductase
MNIGFIGGGNMAEAIISAIMREKLALTGQITVSDIAEARRTYIETKYRVNVTQDNRQVLPDKDVIVLAVKPQTLNDVMAGIKGLTRPEQLVFQLSRQKALAQ